MLYRAIARAGFGALPLLAPFSAKLRSGMAGRRAGGQVLRGWAASHRDRSRPLVWCHAPSAGEGLQARAILELLRARHPDWQVAFTHFSPSAEGTAATQPADVRAYLPPDLPAEAEAALDALAPSALVFVKLDVWPELACRAAARGVPVLLAAATVSPVSGRLRWPARALTRAAYAALSAAGAIADEDAARLRQLGVPGERIRVTGDPRYDSVLRMVETSRPDDAPVERTDMATLVAGSTWPGDEAVLLPAFGRVRAARPGARLILAPHEPTESHLGAVEAAAARAGLAAPTRLARANGREEFLLVDRVGVLARLYGIGDLAYVGGGFGRAGLHSVLEPAAWALPVLFGPRWEGSRDAGLLLDAQAAIALPERHRVRHLAEAWLAWLDDETPRRAAGTRALQVVRSGEGGAEANARLIETAM